MKPPPSILDTRLTAIGIPIEASVPKNPPSICFLVCFITNRPPLYIALLIAFICDFVNAPWIAGRDEKSSLGIGIPFLNMSAKGPTPIGNIPPCCPFPNILFIPSSPSAVAAPVAKAGTALLNPFTA